MMRSMIWRWLKIAALATSMAITLGSVAWGYDNDDYYRHDEAREHGYQNGYQDGLRAGQYDRERGSRFHFKNDQWEDAHGQTRAKLSRRVGLEFSRRLLASC